MARRSVTLALACLALGTLCGCSTSGAHTKSVGTNYNEATAEEPFTHQQELVEEGGRLFVSDGCEGCHSLDKSSLLGPSFDHFAGSDVTLTDGHRVRVSEQFVREALLDPAAKELSGYSPATMIAAVRRLGLSGHRGDVDALAAFIEQIGPEG